MHDMPEVAPATPLLPECRVTQAPVYTYTRVDLTGTLIVRVLPRKSSKAWTSLYTCYVTRAVHLDTVPDQSTTVTFIRCLKRFVALPKRLISDIGKTFKVAGAHEYH